NSTITGLSAPSFAQTSGIRLGCRSVSARSADSIVAAWTSTALTPPMRSAKRFVKRIRGIQQWAVPGRPVTRSGLRDLVDFPVEHRPDPIAQLREELAGHERRHAQVSVGPIEHFRRQAISSFVAYDSA